MRIVLGQTGAPTVVVDQTVRGILHGLVDHDVQVARGGPDGLVRFDLTPVSAGDGPAPGARGGSWLGAGRRAITDEDVRTIVTGLALRDISAIAVIGGNGTMALLNAVARCAADLGTDLRVIGVPKTVDNDLQHIDHAPGFASAAKYLSSVVPDLARDQHAMQGVEPIRVVETLGRGAGWLALAATWHRGEPAQAPDLVLIPELDADEDSTVAIVDAALRRRGRAFVVVSEGVSLGDERESFDAANHTTLLHGGVARRLATSLSQRLDVPARGEVLGMVQRCASHLASAVDVAEADQIGRVAADLLLGRPNPKLELDGDNAVMVTARRADRPQYAIRYGTVPLHMVAGHARTVPHRWRTTDPAALDDFHDWLHPLIST